MAENSFGERLRKKAEEMAGSLQGFSTVLNEDGLSETRVFKGDDESLNAGLEYALEAIGARMARGDHVGDDEKDAIVMYRSQTERIERGIA